MSFENYKNLWVLIETEENTAKNVGYELLTPGRQLADKLGEELVAVVIGADVEAAAKTAIAYGADKAILVEGGVFPVFFGRLHLCSRFSDREIPTLRRTDRRDQQRPRCGPPCGGQNRHRPDRGLHRAGH